MVDDMYTQGALEYISVENSCSSAKIALQGAHIFDFILKEKGSVLFLSEASEFREGKAIRGGVPICWPWFGAHESDTPCLIMGLPELHCGRINPHRDSVTGRPR